VNNNLDFEGFREIFTSNSILGAWQPVIYLGLRHTARGLRLRPQVPSSHSMMRFGHIGYWGAVFDITTESRHLPVLTNLAGTATYPLSADGSAGETFFPEEPFNKVGMPVLVSPNIQKTGNQISITLERQSGTNWPVVAENRYNHVQNGQWVWVSANHVLAEGVNYRVRVHDVSPNTGELLSLAYDPTDTFSPGYAFVEESEKEALTGDFALQVVLEEIYVSVQTVLNPKETPFGLSIGDDLTTGTMQVVLAPDEEAYLIPNPSPTPYPSSGIQSWSHYR